MTELSKLKAMVERSTDLTTDAREASERDRDFYDGFQWTAEETATLKKRKQPVLTINRIKRKIDAMIGIEQRGRVDPSAHPRNPGDEEAADLATKALRYVEEVERIDVKSSAAFENLIVEGYGGCEVIAEERLGKIEVSIKRLRWEEIFYDPYSREKDFTDCAFMGVLKWMMMDAAAQFAAPFWDGKWDDLLDLLDTSDAGLTGQTYDDRPINTGGMAWFDKRQRRVRVAQMYYLDGGEWRLAIFTGKGALFDGPSPYIEDGKPCNPMILMSGYVDRENRRYGVVRDMIPMQEEINKRRSKLLHMLNSRQTYGAKGAVSAETVKRELGKPDGHIEVDIDLASAAREAGIPAFAVIPNTDQIAGQAQLLQEAKGEIDMLGPNASLLGQLQGAQSGRAIMAQQQAGLAELAPIYDSKRDWTERIYRAVWHRIKQFWDEPRWIRITEDEQAPKFIGVNQVQMTPYGPQMMNNVAEIDVDIIVDQAPDYASLRAEQFDKLADMVAKGVGIPPQALIEASDLRDKKKLMEAMAPPEDAAQQQAMQQQVAQAGVMADIDAVKAGAERDRAAAAKDLASIGKVQADGVTAQIQAAARLAIAQRIAV